MRQPIQERSELLLHGRVFDVVAASIRLPSGLAQDLWVVQHPGAVAVAPLLETGEFLLVRQYRHAVRDWLVEIPAGRLEPGETPLAAAKRELEEETGFRARRWEELTSIFPAPGFCSERITLFEARVLEAPSGERLTADPDEELELVRMRPEELLEGATRDAKTLLAAALHLRRSGRP